jgi:hypothetical protein
MECFHDRDAEAFMLAGAQKEIGDFVIGNGFVGDVTRKCT